MVKAKCIKQVKNKRKNDPRPTKQMQTEDSIVILKQPNLDTTEQNKTNEV